MSDTYLRSRSRISVSSSTSGGGAGGAAGAGGAFSRLIPFSAMKIAAAITTKSNTACRNAPYFSSLTVAIGANAAGEPLLLKYGAFLQSVFDFLVIAAAIFMALKGINRLKAPPAPAAPPAPPPEVELLTEIRDLLRK